ncbi:MAG: integration host factor subunit beta [Gammaproteobacteria bacterium]|jgi:integration host factor subunit beta
MNKPDLIELLSIRQKHFPDGDVELAVNAILKHMTDTLSNRGRIEIRGFGVFSIHYRPKRIGRNPKTGESVPIPAKYTPHFKPGKELRERVNGGVNPKS